MSEINRCDWSDLPVHECAHCQPAGPHKPTPAERTDAIVTRLERGEARTTLTTTVPTRLELDAWVDDMTTKDSTRTNGGTEK